jgi:hypothetical protein
MYNQKLDIQSHYHDIYEGEIFQKSKCIWHENTLMDTFRSLLINLNYQCVDEATKKRWKKGDQTVVICLADDFYTCREPDTFPPVPTAFDKNTLLITDNFVTCATQFQVLPLPENYFGIYYYQPEHQDWAPERRFNFSVNRIDYKRISLFCELLSRTLVPNSRKIDLNRDLVNFNCFSWRNSSSTVQECQDNFDSEFQHFDPTIKSLYQLVYDATFDHLPFKNHDYSVEQSQVKAWLNIVVETYSGETSIALSEKIFRALVTPAPWMVYAGQYTVNYLKRLGFDVLEDLVNHRYDLAVEKNTADFGDKRVDFFRDAHEAVEALQNQDFEFVKARCMKAAIHNQQLLLQMKHRWPMDFARWLPQVIEKIS